MRIPKKVVLCVHLFTDWSCPSQCWPRAIQPHSAKSSDHHLTKKVLVAILTQKKKKIRSLPLKNLRSYRLVA
jgi:hypothetical protein